MTTLNEGDRVLVLPTGPLGLSGLGTLVTVCPLPWTGLAARSATVLLDSGETVGVNLGSVL
jgi:hypothetical protein